MAYLCQPEDGAGIAEYLLAIMFVIIVFIGVFIFMGFIRVSFHFPW